MDFEDSIAALTAKEAAKIELALKDLEDLLFVPAEVNKPEEVTSNIEPDIYRDYVQSAMAGYSAHTEEVTQDEVRLWQKDFSYLQIKGEGMLELDPDYEVSGEETCIPEGVSIHVMPHNQEGVVKREVRGGVDGVRHDGDIPDLRVSGSFIEINPRIRPSIPERENEDDEGEVLYSDGALEETLHLDMRSIQVTTGLSEGGEYLSIEPEQCQQAEVVNSLVDIIFPDIVNLSLKPLISKVVQAGREHNVEYSTEMSHGGCEHEMENEDGLFFSASDHYDNDFQRNEDHQSRGGCLVIPDGWD